MTYGGGHLTTYGWQAGGRHPTEMISCFINNHGRKQEKMRHRETKKSKLFRLKKIVEDIVEDSRDVSEFKFNYPFNTLC